MSDRINLRIVGLPEQVERLAQLLRDLDETIVLEESEDYPNRGKSMFVRRYITIDVKPLAAEPPGRDTRQ